MIRKISEKISEISKNYVYDDYVIHIYPFFEIKNNIILLKKCNTISTQLEQYDELIEFTYRDCKLKLSPSEISYSRERKLLFFHLKFLIEITLISKISKEEFPIITEYHDSNKQIIKKYKGNIERTNITNITIDTKEHTRIDVDHLNDIDFVLDNINLVLENISLHP